MINFSKIDNFMKTCINSKGNFNFLKFKFHKTEECDEILKKYEITSRELFYLWKNKITKIPCCIICGKRIKDFYRGQIHCSNECIQKDKSISEKIKNTVQQKYNVDNVFQLQEVKEKSNKTNLERYGNKIAVHSDVVQEKIKQNNNEKFGVDYYFQTDEFKEKSRNTCNEKYGVDFTLQSEEIRNKGKETLLNTLGVDNAFKSPVIQEKIKETNQQKYNVDNPMQSSEIQEKAKYTNLLKYNTEYPLQNHEIHKKQKNTCMEIYGDEFPQRLQNIKDKIFYTKRKQYYNNFIKILEQNNYTLISTFEEFCTNKEIVVQHNCGEIIKAKDASLQHIHCTKCYNFCTSNKEKEMIAYIKSKYNGEIIEHERLIFSNKYELDVYIPEYNLAFEFNGNYWHSTKLKDKNYHQEKTLKCKEKGIELVHIFEYEWDTQRCKIENLIKSKLHLFQYRIYARNCIVKEISSNEYTSFLNLYHLQNSINSSIRYGLFYNDELISVIGFGKSRFKKDEIELHRYCVKPDYLIIGGFSKLIKHSGINNFITYVDLSHFSGSGYLAIGFKQLDITKPNYKWIKGNKILNRLSTQKHKLSFLLDQYDPELSENDNMLLNGYYKLYDAGNFKLEYKK